MKIPRSKHPSEDKCAHLELTSLFYYGLWSSRKGHFPRRGSILRVAPPLPFPRTVHSGASVKDSRRISKNLAGWPDCGERFAVIRLTNCGEANTTKAKPALEGRALFGAEAPEFSDLAVLNPPKIRHRVKRKQPFPLMRAFAPDSSPSARVIHNPNGGTMFTVNALPKHSTKLIDRNPWLRLLRAAAPASNSI
jgi:hypothetical protein